MLYEVITYDDDCLKNVPSNWRTSYFVKQQNGSFEVKDNLKKEVIFRRFNLLEEHFPFKKKFVITSYSIHYTKLYDGLFGGLHHTAGQYIAA